MIFTIEAHPLTTWRFRVIVHDNIKTLRRRRREAGGEKTSGQCDAFYRQWWNGRAHKTGIIGEIHLGRGTKLLDCLVHEAAHAAVDYCRLLRTKDCPMGEERFAESIEHIVSGAVWFLRKRGFKL